MNPRVRIPIAVSFALIVTLGVSLQTAAAEESPGVIAKQFMAAANDRTQGEPEKYVDPDDIQFLSANSARIPGGLRAFLEERTKQGTIETVEITKEDIRGDAALVLLRIKYRDGSMRSNDMTGLVRRSGVWKISLGLTQSTESAAAKRMMGQTSNKITSEGVFDEFTKKVATDIWITPQDLVANPFRLEGKIVAIPLTLMQMISPTEAISEEGVVISDVRKDFVTMRLDHRTLVGGVVKGTKAVKTPFGGEINAPVVSYIYCIPNWDENLKNRGIRN